MLLMSVMQSIHRLHSERSKHEEWVSIVHIQYKTNLSNEADASYLQTKTPLSRPDKAAQAP